MNTQELEQYRQLLAVIFGMLSFIVIMIAATPNKK